MRPRNPVVMRAAISTGAIISHSLKPFTLNVALTPCEFPYVRSHFEQPGPPSPLPSLNLMCAGPPWAHSVNLVRAASSPELSDSFFEESDSPIPIFPPLLKARRRNLLFWAFFPSSFLPGAAALASR